MNDEALKAGEQAADRDPREAKFGFYSGGSFVLDGVRVFSWFASVDELADFLLHMEPLIYDFEGEHLDHFKKNAEPILQKVKTEGLTDALRLQFNEIANTDFEVDWWGSFDELRAGASEFSKFIIKGFADDEEEDVTAVPDDQLDDFVEYLKTCGC